MTTDAWAASIGSRRAGWSRARLFLALAASFVAVAAATARPDDDDDDDKDEKNAAGLVQHVFQEADFDRWVFQNNNDGLAGVRKKLTTMLSLYIDDIDRTCKLSDAQRARVQLAGRGDIKRFYSLYQKVRQKFLEVRQDQQKMQQLWQEINPLQMMAQHGIFDDESLLFRSLHNVLTPEQFSLFDASDRARRDYRHRARIELAVSMFELNVPLTDAQRQELIAALLKLTKPVRKSGMYAYYILMYQLSQIPEEKLKPLFDDHQWKPIHLQLNQYKAWKPWLKNSGQLPDEDEEADNHDAKPAAGKG
jgi:hypothetical protein